MKFTSQLRFLVTFAIVVQIHSISGEQLCVDVECIETISLGKAIRPYAPSKEGVLAFKAGTEMKIKSKDPNSDLLGVEIDGKYGYAPKMFIQESKVFHKVDKLIPGTPKIPPPKQSKSKLKSSESSKPVPAEVTTTAPLPTNVESEKIVSKTEVPGASTENITPAPTMRMVDGTQIPIETTTESKPPGKDEDDGIVIDVDTESTSTHPANADTFLDDEDDDEDEDEEDDDEDDDDEEYLNEILSKSKTLKHKNAQKLKNNELNSKQIDEKTSENPSNMFNTNLNQNDLPNEKTEATDALGNEPKANEVDVTSKDAPKKLPPAMPLSLFSTLSSVITKEDTNENKDTQPTVVPQDNENKEAINVQENQAINSIGNIEPVAIPEDNSTNQLPVDSPISNNLIVETSGSEVMPVIQTESIETSASIGAIVDNSSAENNLLTKQAAVVEINAQEAEHIPTEGVVTNSSAENNLLIDQPAAVEINAHEAERIPTEILVNSTQNNEISSENKLEEVSVVLEPIEPVLPNANSVEPEEKEDKVVLPEAVKVEIPEANKSEIPDLNIQSTYEIPPTLTPATADVVTSMPATVAEVQTESIVSQIQSTLGLENQAEPIEKLNDPVPDMNVQTTNPTEANVEMHTTTIAPLLPEDPYIPVESDLSSSFTTPSPLVDHSSYSSSPETSETVNNSAEQDTYSPTGNMVDYLSTPSSTETSESIDNNTEETTYEVPDIVANHLSTPAEPEAIKPVEKSPEHHTYTLWSNLESKVIKSEVPSESQIAQPALEKEPNHASHAVEYENQFSCAPCVPGFDRPVTDCPAASETDFIDGLYKKVLELFDILSCMVISAAATLLFTFGYCCISQYRKEHKLIAKLNIVERSLLASNKEALILKHDLVETCDKLASIENNSFGSNDMVIAIKQELQFSEEERAKLEEQVASLEKELEAAAEAGLELNKIVSELLSNQSGDESIISSVEELQRQLNEQQNTIFEINAVLADKSRENSELQLILAERNAKFGSEIASLQQDNDELEAEKNALASMMDKMKVEFEQDITKALEGKNSEIKRLQANIVSLEKKYDEEHRKWQTSVAKVEALEGCLKAVKRDPNIKVSQIIDVANVQAELLTVQRERTTLKEKLELETDARKLLEEQTKTVGEYVEKLKHDFHQSEKDKLEAQTRLEVLSNYFKEKETQLQKELSLKEAMWLKQQGETTSTVDRLTNMQEEIQMLKSQNDSLRAEIEAQQAAHKAQIGTLENRAHETWLAARQSERRFEEARTEATALRRKLTAMVGGNVLALPKETNPDVNLPPTELNNAPSPVHMESPSSPLLGRLPPPPPFMPGGFIPPPPPHFMGMPPFMPPPGGMRPPPMGRLMSPPLPPGAPHHHRYSPIEDDDIDDDDDDDEIRENSGRGHWRDSYSPPRHSYRYSPDRYAYNSELISNYDTETDFSPPPSPRERSHRSGSRSGSYKAYSPPPQTASNQSKDRVKKSSKGQLSSGSEKSYNAWKGQNKSMV